MWFAASSSSGVPQAAHPNPISFSNSFLAQQPSQQAFAQSQQQQQQQQQLVGESSFFAATCGSRNNTGAGSVVSGGMTEYSSPAVSAAPSRTASINAVADAELFEYHRVMMAEKQQREQQEQMQQQQLLNQQRMHLQQIQQEQQQQRQNQQHQHIQFQQMHTQHLQQNASLAPPSITAAAAMSSNQTMQAIPSSSAGMTNQLQLQHEQQRMMHMPHQNSAMPLPTTDANSNIPNHHGPIQQQRPSMSQNQMTGIMPLPSMASNQYPADMGGVGDVNLRMLREDSNFMTAPPTTSTPRRTPPPFIAAPSRGKHLLKRDPSGTSSLDQQSSWGMSSPSRASSGTASHETGSGTEGNGQSQQSIPALRRGISSKPHDAQMGCGERDGGKSTGMDDSRSKGSDENAIRNASSSMDTGSLSQATPGNAESTDSVTAEPTNFAMKLNTGTPKNLEGGPRSQSPPVTQTITQSTNTATMPPTSAFLPKREIPIEKYREQLQRYISSTHLRNTSDHAGFDDGHDDDDDTHLMDDLGLDTNEPILVHKQQLLAQQQQIQLLGDNNRSFHMNLSRRSDHRKSPSRGIQRSNSGISAMSLRSSKASSHGSLISGMSMFSEIAQSLEEQNDGPARRRTSSENSIFSFMSDISDVTETIEALTLDNEA